MLDWRDVRAHLLDRYRIAHEDETSCVIVWSFRERDGDGAAHVRQAVEVQLVFAWDELWIEIRAAIAPLERVDARRMLSHCGSLLVGAVATVGEAAVVRAVLRLASLDLADLERAVECVPHEAARLRCAGLVGVAGAQAAFEGYSE